MDKDILQSALRASADCPALDTLEQRMSMPEGSQQRRAAEAHIAECAHCRAALQLVRDFEAGVVRPEEAAAVEAISGRLAGVRMPAAVPAGSVVAPSSASAWWRRLFTAPGLAAALAVAAVLIVVVNVTWRPAAVREDGAEVLRASALHAVSPVGDVQSAPSEFRWTYVQGAAAYVVTVTEVDRTVVAKETVTGQRLAVPGSVRALAVPGKTLEWSVSAVDAAGRELGNTGVQRFRVE